MEPRPKSRRVFLVVASVFVATTVATVASPPAAVGDEILGGKLERKSSKTEAEINATVARLEKQKAAEPKNYRVHFELGNAYVDAGKEEKAKESFEQAILLNPKYVEAMVNLGGLYTDLEQPEEAIPHFEKALSIDPENCKARSNLGNSYYALQRYPDAMFEYNRAVEMDPNCYSAMYNIAVAFADAGLFRDAVKWWKKVDRTAPGTEAARNARENVSILERFTASPPAPSKKAGQ
jgi:tetratricopeptide (TPR) repeat protein